MSEMHSQDYKEVKETAIKLHNERSRRLTVSPVRRRRGRSCTGETFELTVAICATAAV
jgi:hypothetical protein